MALNVFFFLLVLAFLFAKLLRWGRRDAHLPPGPPTTPILGNLLQLPKTHLQLQYVIDLLSAVYVFFNYILQVHRVGADLRRCDFGESQWSSKFSVLLTTSAGKGVQ